MSVLFVDTCNLCSLREIIYFFSLPSSSAEKIVSTSQHSSGFHNYQYENILRLVIRVQLEIILLPVAVAPLKNGVGELQRAQ